MSAVAIERVASRRGRRDFIALPWSVYRGDPHWVPPLRMERRQTLDRRRNPFFRHGGAELFLARSGGRTVGRIAAIRNDLHGRVHGDGAGFFGFFECVDDPEVAGRLLDAAAEWLRPQGFTVLRGPASPSSNDEYGFLSDGFDGPPRFLMPYNPRFYLDLVEANGFRRVKDLLAYKVETDRVLASPEIARVAAAAERRLGLRVRPVDMRAFARELEVVTSIYNRAWSGNWSFVPITDEEARLMAKRLKPLIEPSLVLIAEAAGQPVGMALVVHDYNEILRGLDGRLLPFGLWKLLTGRRGIRWLRLLLIGVLPGWQRRGVDAALYLELARSARRLGVDLCEGSWVLEDNHRMNRIMPSLGSGVYRRYSVYERAL